MFKIAFILSLFAAPLWADESRVASRDHADQALVAAIEKQLTETTDRWMSMNDQERLAHAFAIIARHASLQTALNLTDEDLNKFKTGKTAVTPELSQQISSLAIFEFSEHLKIYRLKLQEISPGHPVALKVGIELMKGISAVNVAMLTAWIGFSGVPIESSEILASIKAVSLIAALYATYRPVAVINILSRDSENERLRLEKVEKLINASPVPEKLWHYWFLIQVFGGQAAAVNCHSLLNEQIHQ